MSRGECRPITNSLPTELEQAEFVMPQEMCYPGLDDIPVPALLYLPPGTRKNAPALIEIHGGPDWHFTFHWNPFMTHAASRGWIVLAPNYRGSTGYGHAWLTANRYKMGSIDTADCTAGQLFLVEQGWADPRRVAVSGRSHGGYLTMMCLTQFPELWAAGSAVVPFLNWFTAHENSREDLRHWDIENFGHPDENQELWYTHSPYFFLERVQAPVQLICSKNDPRCPSSESEAARDRLQELGKEVDFILYQDEGHILLHIENIIDAETRRVDFLAKALER